MQLPKQQDIIIFKKTDMVVLNQVIILKTEGGLIYINYLTVLLPQ